MVKLGSTFGAALAVDWPAAAFEPTAGEKSLIESAVEPLAFHDACREQRSLARTR
jgi:hypothetical protein